MNRLLLEIAIIGGNRATVLEIIMTGGRYLDINSTENNTLELPLHIAVMTNDLQTSKILLSCGADVNAVNGGLSLCTDWSTCLCARQYAIVLAASMGNTSLVKLLLDGGADPDVQVEHRSDDGSLTNTVLDKSALHYAVNGVHVNMVKILLEHGARTDVIDSDGNTPFHLAASCYRRMEDESIMGRPLCIYYTSAQRCQEQVEIIQLLCSMTCTTSTNIVLNVLNDSRFTALYIAVVNGCNRTVSVLLNAGADPDACFRGMVTYGTPLHASVTAEYCDVIETLVQNGSNLNVENHFGNTPLRLSLLYGSTEEVITKLIIHGADTNVRKKCSDDTLIQLCLETRASDCWRICDLLVYAGCKLKQKNWRKPFDEHIQDKHLCNWLREMSHTPNTLKATSRIAIRHFICEKVVNGKSLVETMMKLPLPRYLKEYLLLKDIVRI